MKKHYLLASALLLAFMQPAFCQSSNPAPYCDASYDDAQGFFVDDHINSVSFGTLNNISNNQFSAPHYVFYNNLAAANFFRGNVYTLSINFATAGLCGYGVWIDYNQNNIFETSEKIAGTTGTSSLAVGATPTITENITIPSNAALGNTRLRIRIVEDDLFNMNSTSQLPCNASTSATDVMDWGETEDYSINISSSVGVVPVSLNADWSFYPNPGSNLIYLDVKSNHALSYQIIDMGGRIVQCEKQLAVEKQVDISSLPSGIYFLQLFCDNEFFGQKKLIKALFR